MNASQVAVVQFFSVADSEFWNRGRKGRSSVWDVAESPPQKSFNILYKNYVIFAKNLHLLYVASSQ